MSSIRKLIVKDSTISGKGVFADEDFAIGDVIMIWAHDCFIIREDDYNKEQQCGNTNIIKTGARFVDGYFLYTLDGQPRIEDNMNHSYTNNVLYHCGVCFAMRDIKKGEELFVNYRYVLSKGDYAGFIDHKTNLVVDGVDSLTCLMETTKILSDILAKANKNRQIVV